MGVTKKRRITEEDVEINNIERGDCNYILIPLRKPKDLFSVDFIPLEEIASFNLLFYGTERATLLYEFNDDGCSYYGNEDILLTSAELILIHSLLGEVRK